MCRGERSALAALYDRFAGRMLALGIRLLGDRREAEDILHDVFIQAWARAAEFDAQRGSVEAWLILRMRSRSIDRIRSAERTRVVFMEDEVIPELVGTAEGPQALGWERTALHQSMGELPAEQRQVVALSYFGGLSGSEIAQRLGVPLGTVKSRLAAAMVRMRAGLGAG